MTTATRRAPSLVILGSDALLAARPASPVQLAHACLALGYDGVVPASWGDELVADGVMERLATGGSGTAVLCSCPHVAHRVLQSGGELQPFLVSMVAPPVAAARYLRTLWEPTQIRLTFVGRCAGAADASIDARLTPDELLAQLEARSIDLAHQPQVFDEVIPPDRRRFHSLPGGAPAADRLRERCGRMLVELRGRDLATELAQYLLAESDLVVDVAAAVGCACAGAEQCATPREARATVQALEPPRAAAPVLTPPPTTLSLDQPLPAVEVVTPAAVPEAAPIVVPSTLRHSRVPRSMPSSERRFVARSIPRSFTMRRRPGERPRHPSVLPPDRRPHEMIEPTEASTLSHSTVDMAGDRAESVSEIDRLRVTAEGALAPFIAGLESGEVSHQRTAQPVRETTPVAADLEVRLADVATPIEITREPDIVQRDGETVVLSAPVLEGSAWTPTLKSIAMARVGERSMQTASHLIVPPARQSRRVPAPVQSRRATRVVVSASVALAVMLGVALLFYPATIGRAVAAIESLAR